MCTNSYKEGAGEAGEARAEVGQQDGDEELQGGVGSEVLVALDADISYISDSKDGYYHQIKHGHLMFSKYI